MPTSTADSKNAQINDFSGKKKTAISKPIIMAFIITGGKKAKIGMPLNLMSRSIYVKNAAARVAKVPKTISGMLSVEPIFEIKQPMVSPGIAAGVKTGKIVSTSEIRS